MTETLDGTYTATVDRIVEEIAVFLIEDGEKTIGERHLPEDELPGDVSEGTVCALRFDAGTLVGIEPMPEATAERRERVRERFDALSRRLGDDESERTADESERTADESERTADESERTADDESD